MAAIINLPGNPYTPPENWHEATKRALHAARCRCGGALNPRTYNHQEDVASCGECGRPVMLKDFREDSALEKIRQKRAAAAVHARAERGRR
jgi:hypothetical protein